MLPLVLVVVRSLVQVGLLVRDRLLNEAAAHAGARSKFPPLTRAPGAHRRYHPKFGPDASERA